MSTNSCRFILIFHQNGVNFSTSTHRSHPVKFWVFTQKIKTQCTSKWRHFSSLRVLLLLFDNSKQSITVWFLLLMFYWHCFKAWQGLPMEKLSYTDKLRIQTLREQVRKPSFPVTLTKGGSWALSIKSTVESTTFARPFCVNQAVGRPATASACAVCRCKTIFPLVGPPLSSCKAMPH